jgi:hypothetical protein
MLEYGLPLKQDRRASMALCSFACLGNDIVFQILRDSVKSVIDLVIQRNAFFAHPEYLLLCLLVDDRQHVRERASNTVLCFKLY